VLPDHLLQPLGHHADRPLGARRRLLDAIELVRHALEIGEVPEHLLDALEEDLVEHPLAIPEIVLRALHQRPHQPLPEDEELAEDAAMTADGELVVPRPQPLPGTEVARRVVEEVLDARLGPARLGHARRRPTRRAAR
jgi:hypothetical protein